MNDRDSRTPARWQRTLRSLLAFAVLAGAASCGAKQAPAPATNDAGASARPPVGTRADAGPTLDELRVAAIQKAINETSAERHACWARASADKLVQGIVTLKLKFTKLKVSSVDIASDTTGSEKLGDCLIALYKQYGWQPVFTDEAAIQLPIEFLETRGQYTIHTGDVTPRVLSGTDLRVQVLLDETNTRNKAAALSSLTMSGGLKVPMHRHTSAELLHMRSGEGTLHTAGKDVKLTAGMTVYVPAGVAHGFTHTGSSPALALQLYTPAGPEQRFKGGPPDGTTPVSAAELKRARRSPQPYVVAGSRPKTYPLGGGKLGTVKLVLDGLKPKQVAFQVMKLERAAAVPKHVHAGSTEIILMTSGQGVVTIAGTEYPVRSGHAIQIPPGVEHAFRVTGDEPVNAFQFYTPAGPEQRFKKTP